MDENTKKYLKEFLDLKGRGKTSLVLHVVIRTLLEQDERIKTLEK